MSRLTITANISRYKDNRSVIDSGGEYSYRDLLTSSGSAASYFLNGGEDLHEERVAFIVPPGFEYVSILLGIWRAGGVAVPLCVSHPDPELEYAVEDSGSRLVIAAHGFEDRMNRLADKMNTGFSTVEEALHGEESSLPSVDEGRRAMILYTSGTTSRPKGVVSTHSNIRAQIASLTEAWEWSDRDFILNVLPLHHLHGILNALLCALWTGASCELTSGFDSAQVWKKFIEKDYTLFMAVPTIYSRLIRVWEEASPKAREKMSGAFRRMRLMVSGSAALPIGTLEKWKEISGHTLLERYGMTELGMVLSNPLHGRRLPGRVGGPLPGVDVRLIDENEDIVRGKGTGEIVVRGRNVFLEYWRRPEATKEAFINGEWFRTGDIAERDGDGVYRILGRSSVDIIKSGGYKISALEIEEILREHPDIEECAVVGVEDEQWGERVCAALVVSSHKQISQDSLRKWCKERMAPYKAPRTVLTVDELPRNQMGKVTKSGVVELFKLQ